MNCSEAEQFFDAYLDGELSGSLGLEFDAHRLRCPVCQQKLAMMEACERIIARDTHVPALSDDFTYRVMNEVRGRRVLRLRARRTRIVAAASVLLPAAAVVLFAFLWPFGGNPASDEPTGPVISRYVAPEVQDAYEEKDFVAMYGYMSRRLDQALAAGDKIASDVAAVRKYALNWTITDSGPGVSPASPWKSFWEEVIPTPPADEGEPTPNAAGTFSL